MSVWQSIGQLLRNAFINAIVLSFGIAKSPKPNNATADLRPEILRT